MKKPRAKREKVDVIAIVIKTKLTSIGFATLFGFPFATFLNWTGNGRRGPTGPAAAYLSMIDYDPDGMVKIAAAQLVSNLHNRKLPDMNLEEYLGNCLRVLQKLYSPKTFGAIQADLYATYKNDLRDATFRKIGCKIN